MKRTLLTLVFLTLIFALLVVAGAQTPGGLENLPEPTKTLRPTFTPWPTQTSTPQPTVEATVEVSQTITHIVREGDTFWALGLRYGVDPGLLMAHNNIEDPRSLQIGQELVIHVYHNPNQVQFLIWEGSWDTNTKARIVGMVEFTYRKVEKELGPPPPGLKRIIVSKLQLPLEEGAKALIIRRGNGDWELQIKDTGVDDLYRDVAHEFAHTWGFPGPKPGWYEGFAEWTAHRVSGRWIVAIGGPEPEDFDTAELESRDFFALDLEERAVNYTLAGWCWEELSQTHPEVIPHLMKRNREWLANHLDEASLPTILGWGSEVWPGFPAWAKSQYILNMEGTLKLGAAE